MRLSKAEARKFGVTVPKGVKQVQRTDHTPAVTTLCRVLAIPLPESECYFAKPRMWRFDYCWRSAVTGGSPVALEVEGGIWTGGAHTRGKHYESDCLKYSEAAIRGWRVLRVTPEMLHDGRALDLLGRAFGRVR
jgi:hypothetical protein